MSETCDDCGGCSSWICMGCNRNRCHCATAIGQRAFWISALPRLAHNLAIGAGLCRAFRLGFDEGWNVTSEGFNAEYARVTADGYERLAVHGTANDGMPEWRPGCGRSAP